MQLIFWMELYYFSTHKLFFSLTTIVQLNYWVKLNCTAQQSKGTRLPSVRMTVALLSFFQPERECFNPNVPAVLYYPGLNMTDLPQACCTSSILMLFLVPFPQASLSHTALLSGSHKRCSVPVQKHLHLHAAQSLQGMWVFKQCLLMLSYPRETLLEMEARWEKRQWIESENPEKGSSFIIVTKTPRIALWE